MYLCVCVCGGGGGREGMYTYVSMETMTTAETAGVMIVHVLIADDTRPSSSYSTEEGRRIGATATGGRGRFCSISSRGGGT